MCVAPAECRVMAWNPNKDWAGTEVWTNSTTKSQDKVLVMDSTASWETCLSLRLPRWCLVSMMGWQKPRQLPCHSRVRGWA